MENREIQEFEHSKFYESIPFPIFMLDFDRKISNCNSVAELYLNKSKGTLIETNFLNLFPISNRIKEKLEDTISNVINVDLKEMISFKFINNDNQETWVELFFSSINEGEKKLIQIILQDITEKKLVENIFKEENKKLKELDQLKKQLMAQITENLKSPLSNIFEITDILLNSYKDQLDSDIIRLLGLIKKGGEKSINMIGKILDVSQIESDSLELNIQTENIIETIKSTIEEIDDKSISKQINLQLNGLEEIYSEIDKIRIKQAIKYILLTLIKNKSSKTDTTISIEKDNSYVLISIQLKKFKIKNLKSTFNLKFPKQIIDLHKGQVSISEKNKKDFVINIYLPIKNWRDSLIHIYIIYKSGIPLYDYSFLDNKEGFDASLISGGIIGMITILKAIIRGNKPIKSIDHGDRKIMFETNMTNDIIFVLMVKEDLTIIRNKLICLINEFDKKYHELVENIENTSFKSDNWIEVQILIEKSFQ